jgi:hypothetical protein
MVRLQRLAWIAACAGVLATGCTEGGESFFIVQNQSPDVGCVVPATLTAAFIPRGRIEVEAAGGYLFTPVVQSVVQQSPTGQAARVLFIEGADVTLSFEAGLFSEAELGPLRDGGLARFRQAFSGAIFPGGLTSFAFEIIPRPMIDALAGKIGAGGSTVVTAEVVMFGTLDGGSIEGQTFRYPVEVCDGCLRVDRGSCSALPAGFEPATGGNCQVLQDGALDCCTDDAGNLICPAIAGAPEA